MIGKSYLITSFLFFPLSGGMAITIRTQLAAPDNTVVSQHTYNELFTMHGSLMMYLFAGPFAFGGLANFIVSLQVGAFDMAFPRLNALSYWWYFGGGLTIVSGFFVIGGAADFGWVAYAPLSDAVNSPGAGPDMFICVIASLDVHGRRSGQSRTFTRAPGCALLNRSRKEEPQE